MKSIRRLGLFLMIAVALVASCASPAAKPRFLINGTLPSDDVEAVRSITQKRMPGSHTLYRIEVKSPTSVEVYGGAEGNAADFLVLEKRKGRRWFVIQSGRTGD
jgi:hypothetical protein